MRVENTTQHDITFHIKNEEGHSVAVTVPAAVENPENRKELIHGASECSAEALEQAQIENDATLAFFDEGLLISVDGDAAQEEGAGTEGKKKKKKKE